VSAEATLRAGPSGPVTLKACEVRGFERAIPHGAAGIAVHELFGQTFTPFACRPRAIPVVLTAFGMDQAQGRLQYTKRVSMKDGGRGILSRDGVIHGKIDTDTDVSN